MSGMVERVARAMWQGEWDRAKANERAANEAAGRNVYVSYVPKWDDCNLIFLGYARAAIEAMRPKEFGDLPEGMALAGEEAMDGRVGSYGAAHSVFAAMIDAALAEDTTG